MSDFTFKLVNLNDNQEIYINNDRFSVGRSLQADYVLDSLAVSRIHFYIEKIDGIWTLKDNSTNGTLINDTLIKSSSRTLFSGDVIKIRGGIASLKFLSVANTCTDNASASASGFIVTPINGENFPSVSNDHCYETRRSQGETSGNATSDYSEPSSSNSGSPKLKRLRSHEAKVSPKKCKLETNFGNHLKEDLECSICQELFIKAVTLNCSHTFCRFCIEKWHLQKNFCPMCREVIRTKSPTIVLDNIIEKLVLEMDEHSRAQRCKMVTERLEEKNVPLPEKFTTPESSESEIEYDDDDDEVHYGFSEEEYYDEFVDTHATW